MTSINASRRLTCCFLSQAAKKLHKKANDYAVGIVEFYELHGQLMRTFKVCMCVRYIFLYIS